MGERHPEKYPLLLGVDAGGTKTQAWLAQLHRHRFHSEEPSGEEPSEKRSPSIRSPATSPPSIHSQLEIIGTGSSGPANVRSLGVHQAAAVIDQAIGVALLDSQVRAAEVDAVWIGAAGAASQAIASQLRRILEKRLASNRLHVSGDIDLVVAAAQVADGSVENARCGNDIPLLSESNASCGTRLSLPSRRATCVLAVIAGTGSVVIGHDPKASATRGATCIAGGWGPLIGDRGSGLWFGTQVLQAACQAVDHTGPPTAILSRVLKYFDIDDPRALPEALRQSKSNTTRQSIAGLTPILADLVDHDEVARRIVDQGVSDLYAQINAVFQKLNCPASELRLALAGSVLTKTDFVSTRLLAALEPIWTAQTNPAQADAAQANPTVGHEVLNANRPQVRRIGHPVYGALVLAAETLAETSTNSIRASTHVP